MSRLEFLPCNIKYLAVACKRSNSDVGLLIKSLYAFVTEGKKQSFENEGLQMLYDLFTDDISEFLAKKTKQAEANSNNAKNKSKGNAQNKKSVHKKSVETKNDEQVEETLSENSDNGNDKDEDSSTDDADDVVTNIVILNDSNESSEINDRSENSDRNELIENEPMIPVVSNPLNDDSDATFITLRDLYDKTGNNENEARDIWKRLSSEERNSAFAYVNSISGKSGYRSFLYVFLRDKEWLKPNSSRH